MCIRDSPRLRSGAFAPDFPVVILVRLRLPPDSLGRIEVARHQADPAVGLPVSWFVAPLDRGSMTRLALPADCGRPGGAQSAHALVVVVVVVACALVKSGLLVGSRHKG